MTEQRIRYQHPSYGEMVFTLDSDEHDCLQSALDALGVDIGLFINMAFKWCNAKHPEIGEGVGEKYGEKIGDSEKSRETIETEARAELVKQNVTTFAEFVTTENPDAHWMAGNGELRMFGDLKP